LTLPRFASLRRGGDAYIKRRRFASNASPVYGGGRARRRAGGGATPLQSKPDVDKNRASILGVRHYAVASTCPHPDPPPLRYRYAGEGTRTSSDDVCFQRLPRLRVRSRAKARGWGRDDVSQPAGRS